MWKQVIPTTMQGFGGYCDQMTQHQELTLRDTRDNNTYTIAKLKDGKCWMTQNLMLGGSRQIELSPEDSDVNSIYILPTSSLNGFNNYNTDYVYVDTSQYRTGYYSWYTATAGQGNRSALTQNGYQTDQSICPKGWKLPTYMEYKEISRDTNNYALNELFSSPVKLNTFGVINGGSLSYASQYGAYWTSTSCDTRESLGGSANCSGTSHLAPFVLITHSTNVYIQNGWQMAYAGCSVRCQSR